MRPPRARGTDAFVRRFCRIASETVLKAPWIDIVRHRLADEHGCPVEREVITFQMPDWVNVIARTDDGQWILVRQHRLGTDQDSLEIPGGIIDPGEDPATAAARELREETGYVARTWHAAGWCHPNPAIQGNKVYTFVAEGCTREGDPRLDELEDCRVELVPENELLDRIARREITHALALVALLEHLLLRRRGSSVDR